MDNWRIFEWGLAAAVLWRLWPQPKQIRDYYLLDRCYYDRRPPPYWRGSLSHRHVEGFDDLLAARTSFDFHEGYLISVLDTAGQEAEHSIHVMTAISREEAVTKLKANKPGGRLIHKTPWASIIKRRAYWDEEAKARAAL